MAEAGTPFTGIPEETANLKVFHSGTKLTAGGRVLAVTATASSGLRDALVTVYAALDEIHFKGIQYRRDIGHSAL